MARFDVDGASIYYETEGDPAAPAVLLIHAGIATLRMWDDIVPTLAKNHHVIRFDCRGFGETKTEDVEFSNRADAIALLDHVNVEKATVVGCSRGGLIALDLAVEYPSRVAGVVTIGGGVSGFPDTELTAEEDALIDRMDVAFEQAEWETLNRLEVELWALGVRRDHGGLDPDFVTRAYQLNQPNLAHIHENPTPIPLEPPAYDRLVDVTVPALVMVGDHDLSEVLVAYEYQLSALPKADSARFPDAAHLPSVEQPEEFERVLCRWLAEHDL
ncbi:alpha/beta hydrolase [Salinibacterium sp. SYSU T00001]|uniref:alpha/beta fold hydrolase n=1 Tax=Homoserinimonas sedimenticola TaxID=2986805 RepID=UPI0022355F07|nr:alpha/beta hydrolase [Salinibacterium sedimenticola]MCW4385581.1 alpha/beta hydrolase [Salinibacterium sedimenticola]